MSDQTSQEILERIEKAADRTTHAVRALAQFFYIQLTSTTVGSILGTVAAATGLAWLGVIAGFVVTGGLIWAGLVGRAELRKSKIRTNGK